MSTPRIPCRCEQCHRISYETQEPANPDWWFCAECRRGDPGGITQQELQADYDEERQHGWAVE